MTRSARDDDRGAVLPLVGLALVILILMTSFTIDLGRLSLRRRDLQAVADVMALDLVRLVDGRTAAEIQADPAWGAAVTASRNRNNFAASGDRTLQPLLGCFNAYTEVFDTSCTVPDAVKVIAGDTVPFYFQSGSRTTSRSAVGQAGSDATFSIGSTLLEMRSGDSPLLNSLLGSLFGSSINIGALGYQGLASANVTLDELAVAGGFSTVDDLLNTDLTAADFALLSAQALTNAGDGANAAIFGTDLATIDDSQTFQLGTILSGATGFGGSAGAARVNLFELLVYGAEVANGDSFLDISGAVDTSTIAVPGVGAITAVSSYRVIEEPQVGGPGPVGVSANTAQLEVNTTVTIPITGINVAGGLLTGTITVPVSFSGADATGVLSRIDCNDPVGDSLIDVDTTVQALAGSIAVNGSLVVDLPVLPDVPVTITGSSPLATTAPSQQTLMDIVIGETRSTAGSNLNLGAALTSSNVTVTAAGLPVAVLESSLLGALNPVMTAVTSALQKPLNMLGVEIGVADVTNIDVSCHSPGLVG